MARSIIKNEKEKEYRYTEKGNKEKKEELIEAGYVCVLKVYGGLSFLFDTYMVLLYFILFL